MINDLPPEKQARVHAFSCLFYGKLTELSTKEFKASHTLVARWTKNVNLFDLDFIIIPINLTYHWSVCILTNPGQLLVRNIELLHSIFNIFYSLKWSNILLVMMLLLL